MSKEGAPAGFDPSLGDITLYVPWGNLAIFYRDLGYASGLILLGKVNDGVDKLSQLGGEVTFEVMK